MALIDCKECGHKISEYAVECPKCKTGQKIDKIVISSVIPEKVEKPIDLKKEVKQVLEPVVDVESFKKKKRGPLFIIGGALIIALVVSVFTIYFYDDSSSKSHSNSNKSSKTKQTNNTDEELEKNIKELEEQVQQKKNVEKEDAAKQKEDIKKQLVKNNLGNYLSVSTNNYKQKLLGGIKNLKITVSNISDYPIKQIEVVVNYHRMNDKIYTTKYLVFKNLNPNTQMTLNAPETEFGVYIRCKITQVKAPSLKE